MIQPVTDSTVSAWTSVRPSFSGSIQPSDCRLVGPGAMSFFSCRLWDLEWVDLRDEFETSVDYIRGRWTHDLLVTMVFGNVFSQCIMKAW